MSVARAKGVVKSLFSVWFVLLVIVVVAIGGIGAIYTGAINNPLSDIESAEVADNGTLLVEVDEEYDGNYIVLQHEYDDENTVIADRSIPRFGGTIRFDMAGHIACSDEDYPTRRFVVSLVSLENVDDPFNAEMEKHSTRQFTVPEEVFSQAQSSSC